MKKSLILLLILFSCASKKSLVGNWNGNLETDQGTLNITMKVTNCDYIIKIDNPVMDQYDLDISEFTMNNGTLTFKIPPLGGAYMGQLSDDGKSINGIVTLQNGEEYELTVVSEEAN